jgi:glycosyltransferase involved in cell wall biosynthesis
MRIVFADFFGLRFDACTVDHEPLGGTESAICYLSRALARLGHEVYISASVPTDGVYDGVTCVSRESARHVVPWKDLDALVCVGPPQFTRQFKAALGPRARMICWSQHAPNQPAIKYLEDPAERACYDAFALVSDWQRSVFQHVFGIEMDRMGVLRNAIGFAFEGLDWERSILANKPKQPVLAYTSTPFRGLNLLLEAFPRIRTAMPGTRLRVFSSLRVYQAAAEQDESSQGELYRRCREMAGVEYVGSLPQPALARAMRGVTALAYPNTFAETSCIAAMEAMASGCRVVTTAFGALPETTAGFAELVPSGSSREQYLNGFVEAVVKVLREQEEQPDKEEQLLRRQVEYMNKSVTWTERAREWVQWLERVPRM